MLGKRFNSVRWIGSSGCRASALSGLFNARHGTDSRARARMLSTFVAGEGPFFSFFEISFFPDASRGLPFANRFDGLGPRLRDQQNRATLKSECFAQFAA